MRILGFQKLTLLDYPDLAACLVFLGGCNLRCPFCHNAPLVLGFENGQEIPREEVMDYLKKRKNVLKGVCVTGGEPLINQDIDSFLREVKDLGYLIKLDTNGCHPDKLHSLINQGLVDYCAMDIKNCKKSYPKTVGVENFDISPVAKSVEILKNSNVEHEFRTTLVKELHTENDLELIGQWLAGTKRYFIQTFSSKGDLIDPSLTGFTAEEMQNAAEVLKKYIPSVKVRGG